MTNSNPDIELDMNLEAEPVDMRVDREVDPNVGKESLNAFLSVFMAKRGYLSYVTLITAEINNINILAYDGEPSPEDSEMMIHWHVLQIRLPQRDYAKYKAGQFFAALKNLFSTADQTSAEAYGFSLEPRFWKEEVRANGEVIVQVPLYLHNATLLKQANERLDKEKNAHDFLLEVVDRCLASNAEDELALAAKRVHEETVAAMAAGKISLTAGARICYLTGITLDQPTVKNIQACEALLAETRAGEWSKFTAIGGALLAFLAAATSIALFVVVHLNVILNVSVIALPALAVLGIAASAGIVGLIASNIAYQGLRDAGVKLSLRNFFSQLPKTESPAAPACHHESAPHHSMAYRSNH